MTTAITDQLPPLTHQILNYIKDYYIANGKAPTIRQIQEAYNISSTSVVSYHVKRLLDAGLVQGTPKASRSLIPATRIQPQGVPCELKEEWLPLVVNALTDYLREPAPGDSRETILAARGYFAKRLEQWRQVSEYCEGMGE